MELRHLRTFLAIAEEGSVRAAARRLFTTQPALTRQLAQLERTLETQLFDRTPSGMSLTSAGQRLADEAGRLLARADALVDQFRSDPAHTSGTLVVAVPEEGLGPLTPVVLAAFRAAFPQVDVRIHSGCEFDAIEDLTARRTEKHDLAIWGTSTSSDQLVSHEVYREEVMLATGSASRWVDADASEPIAPKDLLEETFLDIGDFFRRWAGVIYLEEFRNGAAPRLSAHPSGVAADSFDLIANGRAVIGMTPSTPVPDTITLRPMQHRPTSGVGVIHLDRPSNPYVRPFSQIARAIGRDLWMMVPNAGPPEHR